MAGNLTGSFGVGVGEVATDDDLMRLRPVKIAAGFVELAEKVMDVVLSALVQGLKVGGSSMAAYLQKRMDGQRQI